MEQDKYNITKEYQVEIKTKDGFLKEHTAKTYLHICNIPGISLNGARTILNQAEEISIQRFDRDLTEIIMRYTKI